ncbi:MAG: 50S ribosomal protein L29 [Chitinivibrionia bacterium]|nr:50S ribosomal protein L29 [Chitinivibrionia bacterium]
MKPHEMREMTLDELTVHIDSLVDELANLQIKLRTKQLANPLRVRVLRREIAKARTVVREKQLGAKPGQTLNQATGANAASTDASAGR